MRRVVCVYMGRRKSPGGCEIYRGNMPLHYLGLQPGWQTGWRWFEELFDQGMKEGASRFWLSFVKATDILVFPRLITPKDERFNEALADIFYIARSLGKRIVYETDDDYTNEHRFVTEHDAIKPASWSDAVTVTTPYLADILKRKGVDRPFHVLPNCIDPAVWREGRAPRRTPEMQDKIVIALTGSETHRVDWYVLRDVMPEILREFPNVHFLVMGWRPEYFEGLPNTTIAEGVRYDTYAQTIRGCDIILAPVDPLDGFNLGKSPIKVVEGMAAARRLKTGELAGAAVVATRNPIYQLAIKHEENGLLVEHTPDGWLDALRTLLIRPERRREVQVSGFKWVYKHLDISKEWKQWADAYREILNSPPNPVELPTTLMKGQPS